MTGCLSVVAGYGERYRMWFSGRDIIEQDGQSSIAVLSSTCPPPHPYPISSCSYMCLSVVIVIIVIVVVVVVVVVDAS